MFRSAVERRVERLLCFQNDCFTVPCIHVSSSVLIIGLLTTMRIPGTVHQKNRISKNFFCALFSVHHLANRAKYRQWLSRIPFPYNVYTQMERVCTLSSIVFSVHFKIVGMKASHSDGRYQ